MFEQTNNSNVTKGFLNLYKHVTNKSTYNTFYISTFIINEDSNPLIKLEPKTKRYFYPNEIKVRCR